MGQVVPMMFTCSSFLTWTCRSPSYYSPGMYPPPPPMSRPVALVRSSEAATTSPPISTSPGEQHQLRYDLMPPILPPGEHGHAEGEFVISYFTLGIQSEVQFTFKQRFNGSTLMIVFLSPCVRGSATSSLVDPVHSWISSLPCTRLNPLR